MFSILFGSNSPVESSAGESLLSDSVIVSIPGVDDMLDTHDKASEVPIKETSSDREPAESTHKAINEPAINITTNYQDETIVDSGDLARPNLVRQTHNESAIRPESTDKETPTNADILATATSFLTKFLSDDFQKNASLEPLRAIDSNFNEIISNIKKSKEVIDKTIESAINAIDEELERRNAAKARQSPADSNNRPDNVLDETPTSPHQFDPAADFTAPEIVRMGNMLLTLLKLFGVQTSDTEYMADILETADDVLLNAASIVSSARSSIVYRNEPSTDELPLAEDLEYSAKDDTGFGSIGSDSHEHNIPLLMPNVSTNNYPSTPGMTPAFYVMNRHNVPRNSSGSHPVKFKKIINAGLVTRLINGASNKSTLTPHACVKMLPGTFLQCGKNRIFGDMFVMRFKQWLTNKYGDDVSWKRVVVFHDDGLGYTVYC